MVPKSLKLREFEVLVRKALPPDAAVYHRTVFPPAPEVAVTFSVPTPHFVVGVTVGIAGSAYRVTCAVAERDVLLHPVGVSVSA